MSIFSRIFGKGEGEGDSDDAGPGMSKCPSCGTRSASDAAFCGECGATLQHEPPPAQASAAVRRPSGAHAGGPQSSPRPPIAPQMVNNFLAPNARDPRATSPIVAGRTQPRRKSSRPPAPAAVAQPQAGQPPPQRPQAAPPAPTGQAARPNNEAPLTLEPISDRPLPPPPPPKGERARQKTVRMQPVVQQSPAPRAAPPPAAAQPGPPPAAPAPAAVATKKRSPSIENLDRMLEEFEAGFDAVLAGPPPGAPPQGPMDDMAPARELFEAIAAGYVRPVRSFVMELKWCDAPETWLEVCLPTLRTVKDSAEKMGLTELAAGIAALHQELAALPAAKEPAAAAEAKQRVAAAYARLCLVAPTLFAVDDERHRREPVIVQALLKQIPAVRQLELERIYGSGLSSLDSLFLATPEDLAQTAGVSLEVATEVVEVFQAYKRQLTGSAFTAEQASLRTLLDRLKKEHAEYESASSAWSEGAREAKNTLRRDRAATAQRINVVLARLGEVDRVSTLERASFAQKIRGLEAFLEEMKRAGSGLP